MTVDGELYDGSFELYLRSVPEKSQAHGAWISFPSPPFSLLPLFYQNFHINHSFFKIFIIIRFFFI
jgi:hypothetical protein